MEIDLQNSAVFDNLQKKVADIISFDDIKEANKVFVDLSAILYRKGDDLRSRNLNLYKNYQQLLVNLKFVLFSGLSDTECLNLLENYLIEGLSMDGFDFIAKVGLKISFIEREEDQSFFIKELAKILERNVGILGSENIIVNGQNIKPTLANWLKDYFSFPTRSALRTSYDEINYINTGRNVNTLNRADKEKLLKIVKFYDSLKTRIYDYDSAPIVQNENEAFKDFDLYEFFPNLEYGEEGQEIQSEPINENIFKSPESSNIGEISKDILLTPVAVIKKNLQQIPPAIPKAPSLRPVLQVKDAQMPKPTQTSAPAFDMSAKPLPPIQGYSNSLPGMNIQDLLKTKDVREVENKQNTGLNLNMPQGNLIKKSPLAKPAETVKDSKVDKTEDINKKLEELRKKMNK